MLFRSNFKRLPSFSWTKIALAQGYLFQLSDSSSFSNIVFENTNVTDTTLTLSNLLDFNKSYYWRVATISSNGVGGFSLPFTFTVCNNFYNQTQGSHGICEAMIFRMENSKAHPMFSLESGYGLKFTDLEGGKEYLRYSSNYGAVYRSGLRMSLTDYNNDNKLDYMFNFLSNNSINYFHWDSSEKKKYYSSNGSILLTKNFTLLKDGAIEWGDYDNDGDKDLLVTGANDLGEFITELYRNNYPDTAYTKVATPFPNLTYSEAKWFDYNNDGYQDLFLSGLSNDGVVSKIYTNNNGVFTDSNANLLGVIKAKTAVGDLDNDGILELVVAGNTGNADTTIVYKYINNQFKIVPTNIIGVSEGDIALGDLDGEGTLDLAIAGKHGNGYVSKIYYNRNLNFVDIRSTIRDFNFVTPNYSRIGMGDLDGDGDLDVVVDGDVSQYIYNNIYKDGFGKKNTKPNIPTNLKVTRNEATKQTILSWDAATDNETNSKALTYNIRVGTKTLGSDVVSPMADSITGDRKIIAVGNCGLKTSYILNNLKDDKYFFSVQVIDNSYEGGVFSEESSFIVGNSVKISVVSNANEKGTVTGSNDYPLGKPISVYASPKSGYAFFNWTENGVVVSTSSKYTFVATANRSLVANFGVGFTISATTMPVASGLITGTRGYIVNEAVSLQVEPLSSYVFVNWTENGVVVSTSPQLKFTATSNRNLVANFVKGIKVKAIPQPSQGGVTTGSGNYYNSWYELSAIANKGYQFDHWDSKVNILYNPEDYSMIRDNSRSWSDSVTYYAVFKPISYTITTASNPIAGGDVVGFGAYDFDTYSKLIATPKQGYKFLNWTENGTVVSSDSIYTFVVSGDRNLAANFSSLSPDGAGLISGLQSVCVNDKSVIYTVPLIPKATSYIWSLPTGTIGTSSTNSITVDYSNFASGEISVKGHNSYGDGTISKLSITVKPMPASAGAITGAATVCASEKVGTYSVPVVANATSYIWSLPTGASGSSTTNSIKVDFTNAQSGDISVRGHNDCGDGAASTLAVVVKPLPASASIISGAATVCPNEKGITYTVPVIANATSYVWSLPTGASGTSTTNSITVDYTNAQSGDITVKGHNDCGDGVASKLSLTVNPLPATAGVISGSASVCPNQKGVIYTVPVIANATSYVWLLPTGATGISSTNSISVDYSDQLSGDITVKGHNDCGDGIASKLSVALKAQPANAGAITGASTVCAGTTGVIYTVPPIANATSYSWTLPIGASGSSTTNTITVHYSSAAQAGDITVKGINDCGLSGASSKLSITIDLPVANAGVISGASSVTNGQSGVVYSVGTIANATSYVWSLPSGATGLSSTNTISVDYNNAVSGNLTVSGVSQCGVGVPSSLFVTVSSSISAESYPKTGGVVTGGGVYETGKLCTLTATPNSGSSFVNWTENGVEVSKSANYTFTVNINRTLVANFVLSSNAITVSFSKPSNWNASSVYIWAWNSGGTNLFAAWPGVLMKDIGNGWYSYTFPDTEKNINVVFNNGVIQTVDIIGISQSTCYQSSGLNGVKLTVISVNCPSTGVETLKMELENMKLAPNPAKTFVKISFSEKIERIDICDISGRIIRNEVINSESTTLNMSSLQNGIYIVKGYSNGKVLVQRLIKE